MTRPLERLLRRADPVARRILELSRVTSADIKQRVDDWSDADSTTGFSITSRGHVELQPSGSNHIAQTSSDSFITDLNRNSPFQVAQVDYAISDVDLRITSVTAHLDPRETGPTTFVRTFRCQLFRLHRVYAATPAEQAFDIVPISGIADQSVVSTDSAAQDYTFDFTFGGPPLVGSPPINGELMSVRNPRLYVFIWAVDENAEPASAVGWAVDSVTGPTFTSGSRSVTGRNLTQNPDTGRYADGSTFDVPRVTMTGATYTTGTLTFSTNPITVEASPSAVQLIGSGFAPGGTALTFEVDDGVSGFTEYADGDFIGVDNTPQGGFDLSSLALQSQYDQRCQLATNGGGTLTPELHQLGARVTTNRLLDNLVQWGTDGRTASVDPPTLVPEIARIQPRVIRNGIRDYEDAITDELSGAALGTFEFKLWWGHPSLPRSQWLLDDIYVLRDYVPDPEMVTLDLVSVASRLRGAIPVPQDVGGTITRETFASGNVTPKAAWQALIGEIGFPTRYRGPEPEETGITIAKSITDSDVKDELDCVARIARGAGIGSQGRYKFVSMSDRNGQLSVLTPDIVRALRIAPGFAHRQPEFYVPHSYDADAGEFSGEVRAFQVGALTDLGTAPNSEPAILDRRCAEWIASEAVALTVAEDHINALGAGLMEWEVETKYAFPEIEVGDDLGIATEQFLVYDIHANRQLRGNLFALGKVSKTWEHAQRFALWVQSYADLIAVSETAARNLIVTVPLFYGFMQMQPDDETQAFLRSNGYLAPNAGTNQLFTMTMNPPGGAVNFRSCAGRIYWGSAVDDFVQCDLIEVSETGGMTTITSLDPGTGGGGWFQIEQPSFAGGTFTNDPSQPLANQYMVALEMASSAGTDARFLWVRIDWDILVTRRSS